MQIVLKNQKKETKGFFVRVCALGIITTLIVALGAWNSPKEEKKYKVELDINSWQVVLDVIDKSAAPHTTVQAVSKAILDQIKPAFDAEQKRLQDSVSKSQKPKG